MPDALAQLRAGFPVAEKWVYLNHAAVSPVCRPVQDAMTGFLEDAARRGSIGFASWLARRERARQRAATLIGAESGEVAFTTSTSQGLLTVAEGLRLDPGDQIVVVEDDFPANQIPWFRQRRRGIEIVVVPRRDGRVSAGALLAAITPRTRLLAVPWVLYDTGFRLDLPALAAGLAAVNAERMPWPALSPASAGLSTCGDRRSATHGTPQVLLCVDVIQGLGAFPLDVHTAGIDFLSADSHKWLLGVEGIGLFFCRRELTAILDNPLTSWWSLAEPFARWTPESPLHADARRFEYACLPTACLHGFDAALGLLLEAGPPRLAARILELTARLAAGLERRGWTVHSPMAGSGERSGILSASHPRRPAGEVVGLLEQRGVSVTPRGPGVRFAPHGWNTADEIERVLELLP